MWLQVVRSFVKCSPDSFPTGLPCGEDGYSIEKISQSDDNGLYNMSSLQTKYNYSSTSYS